MLTSDKLGCWLALCELAGLYNIHELCSHYLSSSSKVSGMEDLGRGKLGRFFHEQRMNEEKNTLKLAFKVV